MNTIKHYISCARYMISLNYRSQMEYPSFLFGWILSNALQFFIGAGTIKVVVMQFGNINGWSFEQITFMYGMGILAHGLAVILFVQTWYLDWLVRNGEFDRMLLRPLGVYFQFCTYSLNLIGITDMIPGMMIFIYGAISVGFVWNLSNILMLLIFIIGATLIRGGIYTFIGCIGFWTKSGSGLIWVSNRLNMDAIMYPQNIYNRAIQAFFTFVLPLGFIGYYPANYFLGKETEFVIPGPAPLWTLGIGIAIMLAASLLFKMGLQKYDSAGS